MTFGPLFPAAKYFFMGWDLVLYRKQTTRNLTQPSSRQTVNHLKYFVCGCPVRVSRAGVRHCLCERNTALNYLRELRAEYLLSCCASSVLNCWASCWAAAVRAIETVVRAIDLCELLKKFEATAVMCELLSCCTSYYTVLPYCASCRTETTQTKPSQTK